MTVKLQILGMGCAKCVKLAQNAEAAAKDLGLAYTLGKITDRGEIVDAGVMMTPALMIDGKAFELDASWSVRGNEAQLQYTYRSLRGSLPAKVTAGRERPRQRPQLRRGGARLPAAAGLENGR